MALGAGDDSAESTDGNLMALVDKAIGQNMSLRSDDVSQVSESHMCGGIMQVNHVCSGVSLTCFAVSVLSGPHAHIPR